ncbi:MAG: metal ABC transporter permease [Thermoleophilaceae bacterium]
MLPPAATLPDPVYLLELHSTRLALLELSLLAVAGGVLGAFVVLRRLAFFSHAVGTATFPGVVVAQAAGISPRIAALAVAAGFALGTGRAARDGRDPGGPATGLLLVVALAAGTILASDVFSSGASVDLLLFGSVVAVKDSELLMAATAATVAVVAAALLGRAWVTTAFDPAGAPALGLSRRWLDGGLLLLVAFCVVASLPAVGSLLVTSLFVVPAAIALLVSRSASTLLGAAVAVALLQSALGLYASLWLDVPPGPAIAVLGALVYLAVAVGAAGRSRIRATRAEPAA